MKYKSMSNTKFNSKKCCWSVHFIGKRLRILAFIILELSECEVANLVVGCEASATNAGICSNSSRFSRTPAASSLFQPQLPALDNVLLPVQIHSPQMKFTVQSGATVHLPCTVLNLGDNQLLWRHENNILIGNHHVPSYDPRRLRLLEDFTLQLTHIRPDDEGSYECLITTTWPVLNVIHTLSVVDPPTLSIEPDTGSVIVTEGETVRIGCIPKGNPLPQISWSKRDGRISLDAQLLRSNQIVLDNVSRKDTGLYICKADNKVGRPATGSIYVRVFHIPEVTAPNRRVYGGVKYRAELTCIVNSDPKAEVQWLFEQKPIPFSTRVYTEIVGNHHRLILNSVRDADFGMYMCLATNSFGYDVRHIELTGVPKPPVVTKWELSSCIPNSNSDDRIDYKKMSKDHGINPAVVGSNSNKLVGPGRSLLSTTLTSPDCSIQMTLFWVVECYSSLIDYRLIFRIVKLNEQHSFTSHNEDKIQLSWRDLIIPADYPSLSFIHTKSYTMLELQNNSIFEGALKARNKWGSSFLSEIIHLKIVADRGLTLRNKTDYYPENSRDAVIILDTSGGQRSSVQSLGIIFSFILIFIDWLNYGEIVYFDG